MFKFSVSLYQDAITLMISAKWVEMRSIAIYNLPLRKLRPSHFEANAFNAIKSEPHFSTS